jgi:hypothetical protein
MTTTLSRPARVRQAVERYERSDGCAVALSYEYRGGSHVVRVLGESSWRFDDVEGARARWRELRAELRFRGFRRAV